jgi:hypothetical protein
MVVKGLTRMDELGIMLSDVAYKNWDLRLFREGDEYYLQWILTSPDYALQFGRKWVLPKTMSKSEVISTAFKSALTAEEHECRESFKYKGKKIFGPHFDVDVLAEIAGKKENLDIGTPFND